jgi:hypothetical protein
MARHKNVANDEQRNDDKIGEVITSTEAEKLPLEEWPLESLRDYRLYNEEARKMNKKLRLCRYPIKQCPVELHPHQRVRIDTTNNCRNPIPVFVSNHLIHYDEKLIPGKVYDIPECILSYLSEKGNPIWGWVSLADGSKETRQIDKKPRFSLTTVYQGGEY